MGSLAFIRFLCVIAGYATLVNAAKNLVLIGGGLSDDNAPIWNKIIELAGGRGAARVGIITAASADPLDSAEYYEEMLALYGAAESYWIPVHLANRAANSDPAVVANIRRMTGFIFGGGDQSRVTASFFNSPGRVESPALRAIREVYEAGAVISGSSAGVSCLPWSVMIAELFGLVTLSGGVSYNALRYGAFVDGTEIRSDDLVYDPDGGIGMLYDFLLDTHFSERGREGRLIRLIADTRSGNRGAQLGIGVDEDTALVITDADTPSAVGQVIGVSGVFVVDLSTAYVDPVNPLFRVLDVNAHYLTYGDRIDLRSRVVTFDATWKSNLAGSEYYNDALTSSAIFGGVIGNRAQPEFVRVATSLFDSRFDTKTSGVTAEKRPEFVVYFLQGGAARGYGGYSPVTRKWEISYSNLLIDIEGRN